MPEARTRRSTARTRELVPDRDRDQTVAPAGETGIENWRDNPLDPMAPIGIRSRAIEPDTSRIRLGPLEKIYLIWMVGAPATAAPCRSPAPCTPGWSTSSPASSPACPGSS